MLRRRTGAGRALPRKRTRREKLQARDPQTLFQHIFETGPEANLLVDEPGRVVAANRAAEALFGYPPSGLTGQPVEALVPEPLRAGHAGLHRDFIARLPGAGQRAPAEKWLPPVETGHGRPTNQPQPFNMELSAQRADGGVFPAEITLHPLYTERGTLVLCTVRDLSQRKAREQAAAEQTALVRLLQDVAVAANEANSPEDAFQFAVDRLARYLGWPVGHALLVRDEPLLSATTIWNQNLSERYTAFRAVSERLHYTGGVGLPGMVLTSGQPVWITDLMDHPQFQRGEEAAKAGLRTGLAIPVLSGRQVVGVLEFFHDQAIPPDPNLLAVLPHIGVQIGRVVERKRAEDSLRSSAARLRMLMTNLPVFLFVMDRQSRLTMMEGRGVTALNIKPDEMLGRSAIELAAARPEIVRLIERALAGETIHTELTGETGAVFETFFTPFYDANWAVDGVIGLTFDVSERKRMEGELEEMKHRLLESVERERARLGQRLHDGPLQDLYGAFYQFQDIVEALDGRQGEQAAQALDTIQQVTATLRMICGELHPSTLIHLGLTKSIRSHTERIQERLDNIQIHLDLARDEGDANTLTGPLRLAMFRIYQQLINNATGHAQAQHIWVRLRLLPNQAVLEVQDNGRGFEMPQHWIELVRQGRLGLVSTLERVESLNGHMDIETRPGAGTLVRVVIPRQTAEGQ